MEAIDYKKLTEVFKALSDENRLKIVVLLKEGEYCACELLDLFSFSQPTLSYHMSILASVGIVVEEKRGKWMHYHLSEKAKEIYKMHVKENKDGFTPPPKRR